MPALRDRQAQSEFQEGMVRGRDRSKIGKAGCYDIENGLLDEGGDPYRRGGITYKSKSGVLSGSKLDWGWDGYFKAGRRTLVANDAAEYFAILNEDDETPYVVGEPAIEKIEQAAQLKDILFIGGGFMYAGSRVKGPYSTGTVKVVNGSTQVKGTGTEFKVNVDAGSLFKVSGGRVYVVASVPSNTELVLAEAWQGSSEEGKPYDTRAIALYNASTPNYKPFKYLCVCVNRIVGVEGNRIYTSEVNNPHSYTNSLGTENVHELPEGVEPLGVTAVGQTVLIFTTDGLWTLEGLALAIVDQNGNPQHRLQRLSADVLLTGALGLSMWENRVIVPTSGGVVALDETSAPQGLSEQIEGHYQVRLLAGWKVGQAEVYRDHYFLPMINPEGDATEVLVCRLDKPTSRGLPWTRLTENGGKIKAFFVRGAAPAVGVLLGGHGSVSRIADCSSYFTPGAAYKKDADGTAHCLTVIPRDFDTGQLTFNTVRRARVRYEGRGESADKPAVKFFWSKGETPDFGPEDETDESGAKYYVTKQEGGLSDGRDPVSFGVNKSMRRGRFLIKTEKAFASFALRSIELDIRPVGTGRR